MSAPLSEQQLDEIRGREAAATKGPWGWRGNTEVRHLRLSALHSGLLTVMDFTRWGMQGARPRFAVNHIMRDGDELVTYEVHRLRWVDRSEPPYRADVDGIAHPDAEFIAAAREDVPALLAEVERLRGETRGHKEHAASLLRRLREEVGETWSSEVPPGGLVCAECGEPVESEPCPEHHPRTVAERLRAERDQFADRVDTLTSVAQGNKRHVQLLTGDLAAAQAEIESLRAEVGQWRATYGRDSLPDALAQMEALRARVAELEKAEREEIRSILRTAIGDAEESDLPDRDKVAELRQELADREAEWAEQDATEAPREQKQDSPEPTVWRAWHPETSMTLGHYTGRAAAMDHVHHTLANEESTTAGVIETRVIWRADDPHSPEDEPTAWECWLVDADGADDQPTGYVVSPITVAAAYDPAGDE